MSDYSTPELHKINIKCHICLKSGKNINAMTKAQKLCYLNFMFEENLMGKTIPVCIYCGYLLLKVQKFINQCYRANKVLKESNNEDNVPELLSSHNLITTCPEIEYFVPNDIESYEEVKNDLNYHKTREENIIKHENDLRFDHNDSYDMYDEHVNVHYGNDDDDDNDDKPLVMFSKQGDIGLDEYLVINIDKRKKKVKKKHKYKEKSKESKKYIETQLDAETEKHKNDKSTKEGFSSRMVQETDEYTVIKLTKEQVLTEMVAKSKSEQYIRAPYKCDKCVKGFNFEDVLQTHMEKHSVTNGELLCDICSQYCPTVVSMRGHFKSHTTRYKCKACGDVRLSRQHLLEHYRNTHTYEPAFYACAQCSFTTNKRTVLQRHVRTHTAKSLTCHKCGKTFKNIETLRVHTRRHDTQSRIKCPQCPRSFVYHSLLQKHTESAHGSRTFYCVECDVSFKSEDYWKIHFKKAKRHREPSTFKHVCPQCTNRFPTPNSLAVHLTSFHGLPKQHSCSLCTKRFSNNDTLRGHIRRVHHKVNQARRLTCSVCHKEFSRASVLTTHMRTHTGERPERPYVCACGAKFAQRATLRAHTANKHGDKKNDHSASISSGLSAMQ